MNQVQNTVLIITAIVSVFGLSLGVFNLVINIKNRRNSLREKVYEKHLDLFLKFNNHCALIEEFLHELNQEYSDNSDNKEVLQLLLNEINKMDFLISCNEIQIPDKLYYPIIDFINFMNKTFTIIVKDAKSFDKKLRDDFIEKLIEIYMDINEYLGFEKLSRENMRLSRENRYRIAKHYVK